MAWFPIDRLQLEQAATLGRVEAAPVIAERMSVVYQARLSAAAARVVALDTLSRGVLSAADGTTVVCGTLTRTCWRRDRR